MTTLAPRKGVTALAVIYLMNYPKKRNIYRPLHINQQERPYFITGKTYLGLPYFKTSEAKEALLQAIELAVKNYGLTVDSWVILNNHYHVLFRPPGSAVPEGLPFNTQACHSNGGNGVTDLSVTHPFSIGKVMGTIHGKSSSLLKKITGKPVTPKGGRSPKGGWNDTFMCYHDWWEAKYWEGIKRENIDLYGRRSVLAEKKRSEEFRKLLKEGKPQELADFVRRLGRVWYQYIDHVIRDERDYFMHFNYIHQNPVKHGFVERLGAYKFSSIHRWLEEAGKEWLADCFRDYPVVDFEPDMGDLG